MSSFLEGSLVYDVTKASECRVVIAATGQIDSRHRSPHITTIMNRIALVSFALATLAISVAMGQKTQEECLGEFEFWGCQSSTRGCQRLCENKGLDHKKQVCKLDCEKACVCEAGYLRNGPDGECIYDTECPKEVSIKTKKAKTIKAEPKKEQVKSKPKVKKSPPLYEEIEVAEDYEGDEL